MFPVNVFEFEQQAKNRLPKTSYDYFASGANDEWTLLRNVEALKKIQILPRVLRDTSHIDTSTQLFGSRLPFPVLIAPTAFHELAHPRGEIETVNAVNQAGLPMIVSTMATRSLEEIAEASTGLLWFQLYVYRDRKLTNQLVRRAEEAGYRALVVTVDVPIMGKRENDIRNGFALPTGMRVKNFESVDLGKIKQFTDNQFDKSLTWKDIDWLRSITTLPILLKGIMHPADAQLAVEAGVDGIVVSNHGGRQLDSMPATIEMLPAIAEKINQKIPILIDGGFRRGTDLFKALALGADAVLIGRPVLWALACNGQESLTQLFDVYKTELTETMILCGCNDVKAIQQDGLSIILK